MPRASVLRDPGWQSTVQVTWPVLEVRVHQHNEWAAAHEALATRQGSLLLFHGTSLEAAHSVMQNGLRSMSGTAHEKTGAAHGDGVYLAAHPLMALQYARGPGADTMASIESASTSDGSSARDSTRKRCTAWGPHAYSSASVGAAVGGAQQSTGVPRGVPSHGPVSGRDSLLQSRWMRCVFAVEVVPGTTLGSGAPLHQVAGVPPAQAQLPGLKAPDRCVLGTSGGVYVLKEPRRARVTHLLVFHGGEADGPRGAMTHAQVRQVPVKLHFHRFAATGIASHAEQKGCDVATTTMDASQRTKVPRKHSNRAQKVARSGGPLISAAASSGQYTMCQGISAAVLDLGMDPISAVAVTIAILALALVWLGI